MTNCKNVSLKYFKIIIKMTLIDNIDISINIAIIKIINVSTQNYLKLTYALEIPRSYHNL